MRRVAIDVSLRSQRYGRRYAAGIAHLTYSHPAKTSLRYARRKRGHAMAHRQDSTLSRREALGLIGVAMCGGVAQLAAQAGRGANLAIPRGAIIRTMLK